MTDLTIVMSVFNEELFLKKSIESIINQSYQNWKFLIIDDMSTDKSFKILLEYQEKDHRIKVFRNSSNLVSAKSLNFLISKSETEYIARMDADDFSYKERLALQIDFLKNNHNIDVLGTSAFIIDSLVEREKKIMPISHIEISKHIIKGSPIIHPSVMIRKDFFYKVGLYDENLKRSQDYELWLRGLHSSRYHNLEHPLIDYYQDFKNLNLISIKNSLFIRFKYFKGLSGFTTFFWFLKELMAHFKIFLLSKIRNFS